MSKTVILTELKIAGMYVDIVNQKVTVNYSFYDAADKQWGSDSQETYWVTLPMLPASNDSQLPLQYSQSLTDLYNAAKSDLEGRYLI